VSKILLSIYVLISSLGLITLKLGSKNGAPAEFINNKLHLNLSPYVIVGIVLYGTSFALYTYLLSKYDLGYIIPLTTALVYVLIFAASFFIFKESFTLIKTFGIILILIGIIFLNLKQ
jgi:drug/metabolite transporter (DMT)-like permease